MNCIITCHLWLQAKVWKWKERSVPVACLLPLGVNSEDSGNKSGGLIRAYHDNFSLSVKRSVRWRGKKQHNIIMQIRIFGWWVCDSPFSPLVLLIPPDYLTPCSARGTTISGISGDFRIPISLGLLEAGVAHR